MDDEPAAPAHCRRSRGRSGSGGACGATRQELRRGGLVGDRSERDWNGGAEEIRSRSGPGCDPHGRLDELMEAATLAPADDRRGGCK